MATPILYIGLGTSGLRMLEESQRFFYSCSPNSECRPSHTRFLFVETDATQEPAHILGGPADENAIEVVRTPIPAAEISVNQLEKLATVRVVPSSSPPADSQVVLKIQERKLITVPLGTLNLSDEVYRHYAHIFSKAKNQVADASLRPMDAWIHKLGLEHGSISIRLREDLGKRGNDRGVLEVYVPEMPSDYLRRIEVLFNNVELVHLDGVVSWLPPADKLAFAGAGAGGMRSFGRIALWGESDQGQGRYMRLLREEIDRLYKELLLTNPNQAVKPLIYVTGTFTGGTNSGMFIDVAYLCRDIIDPSHSLNADVLGMFLLPPDSADHQTRVSNAYACLRDLGHFSMAESQFLAKWPTDVGVPVFPQGRTPFELTTLLSLSWMPDGKIETLYRVAGLYLFLLGTSFGDFRKSKIVDVAQGGQKVWKFSAVGMTSLFYPRGEIRQCAASKFSRDFLIKRWLLKHESQGLAAVRSLKKGNTVPHDVAMDVIKPRIRRDLNEVLEDTVKNMLSDGPNNQHAIESIHTYLDRVKHKKANFSRTDLINLLGESGEFYTRWKNRIKLTMEELHQQVGERIVELLEDYENLPLGRKIVAASADVIDQILYFWKPLAVDNWSNALARGNPKAGHPPLVDQLLVKSGRTLGQGNAIRIDRFEDLFRRMCISILREPMLKFGTYLREGSVEAFTPKEAKPNADLIPSVESIRKVETFLEDVRASLLAFEEEVGSGVNPNDVIHYHLRTGKFQRKPDEDEDLTQPGDVDEATEEFRNKHEQDLVSDDAARSHSSVLLGYGTKNLWGFLSGAAKKSAPDLGAELIGSLSGALKIAGVPHSGDASSITHHSKLPTLAQHAMTHMSIKLGVDEGMLHNAPNLPKIVVTGDAKSLPTIDAFIKQAGVTSFVPQASACDELLGDMVVFFDERPVAELDDLARLDMWEPVFNARRIDDPSVDCYIHT